MSQQILSAEHISVTRTGTEIVQDISLQLNKGEVLAIIGPNGAGKTTLMKALLGLLPSEGIINWDKSVRIGYVPQKVSISRSFPLTVQELFALKQKGVYLSHDKTKDPYTLFARVGIIKLLDKRLSDLSGGELQRVLIAFALVGDTNVLCLDEPSAGIDVGGGKTMYGLLRELSAEEERTIILISHDIDVVFKYADQVLCIDKRMICKGKPASVLTAETLERMYGGHTSVFTHHDHA